MLIVRPVPDPDESADLCRTFGRTPDPESETLFRILFKILLKILLIILLGLLPGFLFRFLF